MSISLQSTVSFSVTLIITLPVDAGKKYVNIDVVPLY
jgi:hypothetical protein